MALGTKKKRKLRERLHQVQGGLCFYCKKPMRLEVCPPPPSKSRRHPKRLCTLEHLYPIGDPRRSIENKMVAACYACNKEQNIKFMAEHRPNGIKP